MKYILTLLTIALLASTSFAQEAPAKEKKGKKIPWQAQKIVKTLKGVELTEEQSASLKEASMMLTTEMASAMQEGLTPELIKGREEKKKEARAAGIKGKELKTHLMESMSEEETDLLKGFDQSISKFEKSIAMMLTPEQIGELPEKSQKRMTNLMKKGKSGKKKGGSKKKKKMEADEESAE